MTLPAPAGVRAFHKKLARWYEAHGRRELPWRNTRDAYAIYLSEAMLQQTQVKTVLERFYHPFLTRFPSLAALASADEKDVLHAWQGLGYYSRARNLHRAAQMANGKMPNTVEGLIALPGIGRNTAHAVAAFAYHLPVPVLEANVKRVVARIFALKVPNEKQLWEYAGQLLNRDSPFNYNQAMMDIGSMVCTRRMPDCPACPANNICQGKHDPEAYPAAKVKKGVPVRRHRIVVLQNAKGQYYATPRESRFLGGLYHFVELAEDATSFAFKERIFALKNARMLGDIVQKYSHFTLEAQVFLLKIDGSGTHWHGNNALRQLPFSNAEQKILQLLTSNANS